MERAWRAARRAVSGRRRHSRAAAAVDLLAAAPLVSATSLAAGLGMAVKNATLLLDDFCAAGIAIEVTHRSKRRLFGLTGLAPLRDVVRPPYRPEPGRGRGRPPLVAEEAITVPALPPVPPLDRQSFDYSDLGGDLGCHRHRSLMSGYVRQRCGRADEPDAKPDDSDVVTLTKA